MGPMVTKRAAPISSHPRLILLLFAVSKRVRVGCGTVRHRPAGHSGVPGQVTKPVRDAEHAYSTNELRMAQPYALKNKG